MFEWVHSTLGMDFSAFLLELECDGKGFWGKSQGREFQGPIFSFCSAINWLFVHVPFHHLLKKKKKNKQTEYFSVKFTGKQKPFYNGPDNISFVDHIEFVLHILGFVCSFLNNPLKIVKRKKVLNS